jgi:penicillin-binding protein 2
MQNRPTPLYESDFIQQRGAAWDIDAEPGVRLGWLFLAMTLPLLVVAGRLIYLQGFVAEGFAVEARKETETIESIPARHGRILSSDGTVLAQDEERYQLFVHYRWLEEPPNEHWVRAEALALLSRAERRDAQKVEQAKARILRRRDALWQSLSELTERGPETLAALRAQVQQRVERIHRLVDERRAAERSEARLQESRPPIPDRAGNMLEKAWQVVKHELTTPPTRERLDPLRITEQTSDHLLLEDVSLEVVAEIETHPHEYPGVRAVTTSRRVYPHGRVAPHLVGHRGQIDSEELAARRRQFPSGDPLDYQPGDTIGRSGIELAYEPILRGVRGKRKVVRDRHGTVIRTEVVTPPRPGRDVVLNISVALQESATKLLEEAVERASDADTRRPVGGCLVAIDVQTGAVLAAASVPTFDINDMLSGSHEIRQALLSDPRRPMFPRATQMALPPGSVFKTVSAVAILESYRLDAKHRIDPDRPIECVGYLRDPNKLRCYHGTAHYATDLTKAIAQSCNVYFFHAAERLGPEPLVGWADQFGFGQRTEIDIPGERSGHLPRPPNRSARDRPLVVQATGRGTTGRVDFANHSTPEAEGREPQRPDSPWDSDEEIRDDDVATSPRRPEPWYPGDTLGLAIGQSRLTVTPLQVARLMAAIANDGWLLTPHVAREILAVPQTNEDGSASDSRAASPASTTLSLEPIAPVRRRIENLSDGTLARVREGMEQVVNARGGTGFNSVRMSEVKIAGKTGTAEIGGGRPDHAWFAGYVPADRPRIAFVVVLEQAGSGGKVAGPVAKKFVQLLLDQGLIRGRETVRR